MVRRKYAKSVKRQRIATHFRRMETRSKQVHECKAVRDNAPDIRERDRLYQLSVLTRWVQDYYAQSSDDKKIKMLEEGADKKIYPEWKKIK